jgi:hypothetical protein
VAAGKRRKERVKGKTQRVMTGADRSNEHTRPGRNDRGAKTQKSGHLNTGEKANAIGLDHPPTVTATFAARSTAAIDPCSPANMTKPH